MEVECVASFKLLDVNISEDVSWTLNTSILVKKAHQRLLFLKRLVKVHLVLRAQILLNFYHCTKSTNCIPVCKLLCLRPESTAKGCENCPSALLPLHSLPVKLHRTIRICGGVQYRQGHFSARPQTVCPPTLWEALQESKTSRLRNSFFPQLSPC